MSILSHIDDNLKQLISRIIDEYQMQLHYMEDCTEFFHGNPGIHFGDAFSNAYTLIHLTTCCDKLAIIIDSYKVKPEFNNLQDNINYSTNNGAIIHAEFIQAISFLKSLYDNGYIFFTEDNSKNKSIPIYQSAADNSNCPVWTINSELLTNFAKQHFFANIIPSPALISFYRNDFKNDEQLRYEKQLEISNQSLEEAHIANLVAKNSLDETKKSNDISQEAVSSAKRGNQIAIIVAIVAMLVTILSAIFIPVSLNKESIHDIGLEIGRTILLRNK